MERELYLEISLVVEIIPYKLANAPITFDWFPIVFKGAYWISSNSSFIQYCNSNIGLFSIAPHLVIALPTLR